MHIFQAIAMTNFFLARLYIYLYLSTPMIYKKITAKLFSVNAIQKHCVAIYNFIGRKE